MKRALGALALLLVLSPAFAKEAPLERAIAVLDRDAAGDASLAPLVVEARVTAGLGPGPALGLIQVPAGDALLPKLRPAYALALAGRDLREVGGRNLVAEILASFDGAQFGDRALLLDDAWSIVVLATAGAGVPERSAAASFLRAHDNATTHGWSWRAGGEADVDSTGMVLWALSLLGPPELGSPEIRAMDWLLAFTTLGWGSTPGEPANCDSTVWGMRSFHATRLPIPHYRWDALLSFQRSDGSFSYLAGDAQGNLFCTAEAAILMGMVPPDPNPTGLGQPGIGPVLGVALLGCALVRRITAKK